VAVDVGRLRGRRAGDAEHGTTWSRTRAAAHRRRRWIGDGGGGGSGAVRQERVLA